MSRADARSTSLRHRPSRSIPAVITCVVLAVAGVLLLWIGLERLATGSWPSWVEGIAGSVATWQWGSTTTLVAMIIMAVVGLIMLLAAILPGSHNAVAITADGRRPSQPGKVDVVMGRRAIARLATAQADLVDGVDSVSASVSPTKVHLSIATSSGQTETVRTAVVNQVSDRLRDTGLQPVPRVAAQVRSRL